MIRIKFQGKEETCFFLFIIPSRETTWCKAKRYRVYSWRVLPVVSSAKTESVKAGSWLQASKKSCNVSSN